MSEYGELTFLFAVVDISTGVDAASSNTAGDSVLFVNSNSLTKVLRVGDGTRPHCRVVEGEEYGCGEAERSQ